ncbi:MAG: alginate export family protein [Nitrospirae bacterium]|nr:alginate export family protein [Nitrospirota bacterium]
MKRSVTLVLGILFILGLVIADYAAAQDTKVTLGGELRFRGWYIDNNSVSLRGTGTPADTGSQSWYDGRIRLGVNAEVSKNTTGYVQLESGSTTGDTYTWGTNNTKPGTVDTIRQAWIQHKGSGLLGIPAGFKVGHQLFALGEKQFLDHTKFGDDMILITLEPTKELEIGLVSAKVTEASAVVTGNDNDTDGYIAGFTYKGIPDLTVGANYTQERRNVAKTATDGKLSFQNIGVHANGKAAGLSYKAEFDTQFGDYDLSTQDRKFKGYGLLLGAGYSVAPVGIRAEFASGSGDTDTADNKIKEFQTTMGNDVHYTFIYEYTTRSASRGTGSQGQVVDSRSRATGIANTTYYRLGFDVEPVKDLKASIDGFILRATEELTAGSSKNIGTEVDVNFSYKIDKNLTYFITAGILDPGKFWEGNGISVASANNKTITQAVHGVTLSF